MNQEEKDSIIRLCTEFSEIFFLEGDKLSCTKTTEHEIKTPKPFITKIKLILKSIS